MSAIELQRERNIAANKALLAQLGLEKPSVPVPKPGPSKKRKLEPIDESLRRKSARVKNIEERARYEEDSSDLEAGKSEDSDEFLSASDSDEEGPRIRKSRRRGRAGRVRRRSLGSFDGETTEGDATGLKKRTVNGRRVQHIDRKHERPDPRVFGHIEGIPVGKWWPTRLACSVDSIHPPPVSGIFGSGSTGAYSVAVSGGYEDDVDEGFRFTYTGSGGRDLKGTKNKPKNLRTAPQSCNQTLTGFNLALKTSCDTGEPVRVIRGFKAELGPAEGYRYDGLYIVMKAWEDMGMAGFKVWKFAFKRVDGQLPINFKAGPPPASESEAEAEAEAPDENSGDELVSEKPEEAKELVAIHSAVKKQTKAAKKATSSKKQSEKSEESSQEVKEEVKVEEEEEEEVKVEEEEEEETSLASAKVGKKKKPAGPVRKSKRQRNWE